MTKAISFGILQGLTEFLPVSSSGHLFLAEHITGKIPRLVLSFSSDAFLSFVVYLHLATLCSLIIFFHKELIRLVLNRSLLLKIIYASSVTVIGVLLITFSFAALFENRIFTVIGFALGGSLLLLTRRGGGRSLNHVSFKDCTIIGIVQACAVCPGLSRSGVTITTLMRRGFTREDSFTFSFLLAIPTILGAFLYKLGDLTRSQIPFSVLASSFIATVIAGLIALILLKKFTHKGTLYRFGYYCATLSIITIFL